MSLEQDRQAAPVRQERLWNTGYIMILLVSTLSAFSFYTNQTILSKYLTDEIGVAMSVAGMIVGLFSLTSLFCRPFCGVMSDRLNKKALLLVSNLCMAAGLIGFAYLRSVPMLVAMRILNGIGFAIGSTVQVALCTSFIPKSRMGEGIGYMGLSMVLGSAVAPGLGIFLAKTLGMKMVFLASAAMPVLGCALLLLVRDDTERSQARCRIALTDVIEPKAWAFSLCGGMFSFVNGIINAYIVLFAEARNLGDIALYFTVYALCLFVIRPLSGKLTDRKGLRFTVIPSMLLTAFSMLVLCSGRSLIVVLVSAVLRAVGQGSAQPSLQAGCINYIGKERAGVATSTYYLCGDVGQGVGPMLGGVLLTGMTGVAGYQTLFCLCAGLLVLGCAIFAAFTRRKGIR